jgi:uncharacterized Zn finger protein
MSVLADWFTERALMDLVPPDVFLRGTEAAEHGAVQIEEFDDEHLLALVVDLEAWRSEFRLAGDALQWSCTCGKAEGLPCHHLIAGAVATWPGEAPVDE